MRVLVIKKAPFSVIEYAEVTNLAYNADTNYITITFGSSQTASYNMNNYLVSVLW